MRGRRVRFNEGDGEVDENFWAQAAADQAAGRSVEDEADESELPYQVTITACFTDVLP